MTTDRAAPVTDEQIAEWLRLADAATEGPWIAHPATAEEPAEISAPNFNGLHEPMLDLLSTEDAMLMAASRTAVPALCAKVKEQAAEIERLREALRKALTEIESGPECCGRGQPVVQNNEIVGQECCGCPEYGFERAAVVIRSALPEER